ncbi:MAG: hypothetical protein OXM55_08320 [Bdellovibrionales bacterium]|nr:hypothetical protein [Bdellovibrionales bacterium]
MFTNYKIVLINYILMIIFILFIAVIQNSLWPSVFGTHIPTYLWIPCLIYWALYRKTGETVFMLYFITLNTTATSPLLTGYLLIFHSLALIVLFLFKRIYYTSWVFFSTACAFSVLFFPIPLWFLSRIINGTMYLHGFLPWIGGCIITWILSFPILGLLKWIDHRTIGKSAGYKPLRRLV